MFSIDLAFRLTGSAVPVDHGYALYAALSRILPDIHTAKGIGVQPIRGIYSGNGTLHLADFSRLILRLPDEQIRVYLPLAGKRVEVDEHRLSVGCRKSVPFVQSFASVRGWPRSRDSFKKMSFLLRPSANWNSSVSRAKRTSVRAAPFG